MPNHSISSRRFILQGEDNNRKSKAITHKNYRFQNKTGNDNSNPNQKIKLGYVQTFQIKLCIILKSTDRDPSVVSLKCYLETNAKGADVITESNYCTTYNQLFSFLPWKRPFSICIQKKGLHDTNIKSITEPNILLAGFCSVSFSFPSIQVSLATTGNLAVHFILNLSHTCYFAFQTQRLFPHK